MPDRAQHGSRVGPTDSFERAEFFGGIVSFAGARFSAEHTSVEGARFPLGSWALVAASPL